MKNEIGKCNYLNYICFNLVSLLSMIMLTDISMICGIDKYIIPVYKLVEYVPQAIILIIAPFICHITYFENIPQKWKIIKLGIIGIMFTISMLITVDSIVPILTSLYQSVEVSLLIYPIMFYISLGFELLSIYIGSEER